MPDDSTRRDRGLAHLAESDDEPDGVAFLARMGVLGEYIVDTFAPLGPCIRSIDGIDLGTVGIRTTVSGEVMQESSSRSLIFSVADLIAYLSRGVTLYHGDLNATGTPGGVGDSRSPRRYLRAGDTVDVWVEGVGTLSNPMVLEH